MKRYKKLSTTLPDLQSKPYTVIVVDNKMCEDPEGEWVRFEDVKSDLLNKKGLKECDPDEKVFCKDCEHFSASFMIGVPFNSVCHHPKNREDSFYKPDAFYKSHPQEKNKNNDCGDFEEKGQLKEEQNEEI